MTSHIAIRAAALAAGAALLSVGAAAPAAGDDQFGQHVRNCAQTTGFHVDHNPGLHQGKAGWPPEHTC